LLLFSDIKAKNCDRYCTYNKIILLCLDGKILNDRIMDKSFKQYSANLTAIFIFISTKKP
jgi:hypothetical protein